MGTEVHAGGMAERGAGSLGRAGGAVELVNREVVAGCSLRPRG